jgi:predicted flap endonuclease-1-like 5' DNA nuclease
MVTVSWLAVVILALIAIGIGFLIGWLIEWRVDLAYWRSYFQEEKEQEEKAAIMVLEAKAKLAELPPPPEEVLLQAAREQLAQRDTDLGALRATIEQFNANEARWRDRENSLLEELRRLRAQFEEQAEAKNDAEAEWRHELARREQRWEESKTVELAPLHAEAQRLQERLAEVEKKFADYRLAHPPGLADIPGLGRKAEAELSSAGISTYADLAARTPDELRVLLNPPKWRHLDFESWIAAAKQLAQHEQEAF